MTITYQPPTVCPQCGHLHMDINHSEYSASCPACGHVVWPPGPGVVMVGIIETRDDGIVLTERAINPGKGKFCFPCGYMIQGEDWRECLSREVYEETGGLQVPPDRWDFLALRQSTGNKHVLLFAVACAFSEQADEVIQKMISEFKPTKEVNSLLLTELTVDEIDFAFPVHGEVYTEELWDFTNESLNEYPWAWEPPEGE